MAEWLFEAGIGESRAALVEQGRILELAIEIERAPSRVGAVLLARLLRRADAGGRGRVRLADGEEADLQPVPPDLTEGAALLIEIMRDPWPEAERLKPARARPAAADAIERPAVGLVTRLAAGEWPVRSPSARANGDDPLEASGWSEALEDATSGVVARDDAMLRISLTPAMTLIDVDGAGAPLALAIAGARRAAQAIRRFGLTGSIGIDLPTLTEKAQRRLAGEAFDAAMPPPFERAAVNAFGLLHLVRRRERPSIMEQVAHDPIGHAARALLRRGEQARGHGAVTLAAAAPVIARIEAEGGWRPRLERRIGAPVRLMVAPGLAISAGHAQRDHA